MLISTISGNLGRDPEMVTTPFDQVKFSVGVKVGYKDPKTVWHNVSISAGAKAKFCYEHLKKGDKVTCVVEVQNMQINVDNINVYCRLIEVEAPSRKAASDIDEMPF